MSTASETHKMLESACRHKNVSYVQL